MGERRLIRHGGVWSDWANGGTPYLRRSGAWVQPKGMYRMLKQQTGFSPPTFSYTWVRIFDNTPPTATPSGYHASDGSLTFSYPHTMRVDWTSQAQPYLMSIRVFQSTNFGATFNLVGTYGASDGSATFTTPALFNASDIGYAELKYQSLDGGFYGPAVNTAQVNF